MLLSKVQSHDLGYTIFLICATVFSIAIKTWIFSVILSLHRYLRFEEEYGELVYAQYVNGGVRIDTNSGAFSYPATAPPFSADASGAPPQYFNNTFDGIFFIWSPLIP
ncbi:unnamed protein product [Anisakis simplex]|uniref:Anoctamin n=1 Tax=Anisakis simplex TaxID=6269 RepID=A0A0M3JY05_ANISI|nr:unnamed protein product [Anisakis simplex]